MYSSFIFVFPIFLIPITLTGGFRAYDHGQPSTKLLYKLGTPCTYSYQVTVHTARGSKSTANQGYELHTLVEITPVTSKNGEHNSLNTIRLNVYQPRIRRLSGSHVLVNHPVNEELEEKLSNPFYFRQYDHGTVVDVFFPKNDDHHAIALKKGIAGAFQVNLKAVGNKTKTPVKEHDDSGVYYTSYHTLLNNDTHTTLKREWTNNDYLEFADGTPVHGEHKIKLHHSATVQVQKYQIYEVHRIHKGIFSSQKRNPRAENKKLYQEQDIQISTSGYNKLTLVRCNDVPSKEGHHRSRRSAQTTDNLEKDIQGLRQENLVFRDLHKIDWKEVGGDKMKFRPFYELMRCLTDPTLQNEILGECARELYDLIRHDEKVFTKICNLVLQRNHQNLTSWSVLVSAVAGHGGHQAQSVLSQALMSEYPHRLTLDEYETLLEGIFYIPKGPIHRELFDALFTQAARDSNHGHKSSMAMLVLAGLTKRAQATGYNSTLSDVVAALIHDSYCNKSNVHDPDSVEHESYVRDHIWAFGNLGHSSGLEVMLDHADHDNSDIRSAVVSSMRKLHGRDTNNILMDILYKDETSDVKAAVIEVFIERHEDLTDKTVQALEHAIWHAEDGDTLDSAVQTFLENHHDHPKINHIRKKRRILRRRKRALIPFLKPREYAFGPIKRWSRNYGGNWLGAETIIQFTNKIKFRLGIFGGKFEIDLDNSANFNAHIFKWKFDIVKAKAAFKATAAFKNDIPKDLIHLVADFGDQVLKIVDGITNVFVEQLQNFIYKLVKHIPLKYQKLVDFFNGILQFVESLTKPLKPIQAIGNIIHISKNVFDQVQKWNWMMTSMKEIQNLINKLNAADGVFRKVTATLDQILDIGNRIKLGFPYDFDPKFKIEELLTWLRHVPLESQDAKIKAFFTNLRIPEPAGFKLQLPFRFAMHFPLSMDKFEKVCIKVINFANGFLDMLFIFDELHNVQLPHLILPQLEGAVTNEEMKSFDFGLRFDWKKKLNFNLDLGANKFIKFVKILGKLSEFFKQFHLHSFDLETFFENIMPGKSMDIGKSFTELLDNQNSLAMKSTGGSPDEVFKNFVKHILRLMDSSFPEVSAISDMSDFFKELGRALNDFSGKSLKTFCHVSEFTSRASNKLSYFIENIDKQGTAVLNKVDEVTQGTLNEVLNYTSKIDVFVKEIHNKLSKVTDEFVTNSLSKVKEGLGFIQLLSDQFVQFANETSFKATGVCINTADFSAQTIDKVQNISRDAISELVKFIGPVAHNIKNIGQNLKRVVSDVEKWYIDNMDYKVGIVAKAARLIADLMSIVNTRKGLFGTVREVAVKINDVLSNFDHIPLYAKVVRDTVDDIIKFADGSKIFQSEIMKLDIRKQFGVNYDMKLREFCNTFKAITSQTLDKISGYDIIERLSALFERETNDFKLEVGDKLQIILEPLKKTKHKLEDISKMVNQITSLLVELKPIKSSLFPVLSTINKLPNCRQMKFLFTESIKPCVKTAMLLGKGVINHYNNMRKQVTILYNMIPETWKNVNMKSCLKGEQCLSKSFINQVILLQKQMDVMQKIFADANNYNGIMETCGNAVQNISAQINTMNDLIVKVKDFGMEKDVKKIQVILQSFTGRGTTSKKHANIELKKRVKRNANKYTVIKQGSAYINMAKEVKMAVTSNIENTFKGMQNVYLVDIIKYNEKAKDISEKLKFFFDFLKRLKNISPFFQSFNKIVKDASVFANTLKDVTSVFSGDIQRLLTGNSELSKVIKPHIKKAVDMFQEAFNILNDFIAKIQDFLKKIQLRQRGLDLSQYKEWSVYPYCSADVCLRSLRRSSSLYYSVIFTWKFPHLDDLSSMKDCGRWLIPGLFDDYKVEGISQLSQSEILLGLHGISVNHGKASILIITTPASNAVRKIIQLGSQRSPFTEKIGGVSVARNSIWISSGTSNKIYRINKGSVTGSMSSSGPSWVEVSDSYTVEGTATSVSFDEVTTMLWVTDGVAGKGYGYRLSPDGDLPSGNTAPDRVLVIGKEAQGMTIVRQFGTEYVVVSRCAMRAGFQCKLEFHDLSGSDEVSENTLSRVVRTPSGLESVEKVRNDLITIVFSSATYSERNKIQLMGGDFEDRYFRMKLPILKMTFAVHENCLFLSVLGDWIIKPRKMFPFGDLKCGKLRKRSVEDYLFEEDVYSEELEKHHIRKKRDNSEISSCSKRLRGLLKKGHLQFGPELEHTFIVYGISIRIFAGARGYYTLEYDGQLCLKEKAVKLGIIPGVSVGVYAGASISLIIVEAGVTIEAILLETKLIPELTVKLDKWPLQACLGLRMEMTPLKMKVYLWYRFRCISVKAGLIWISVEFRWCKKNKFAEWSWSTPMIKRQLFSTECDGDIDKTPPVKGTCEAKQVGDQTYFIQWHGFREDKKINHYLVKIGSIEGSGDDHGANVGTSLSTVVRNLPIMHGRDVYVSVKATNDMGMDSKLALCPMFKAKRREPQILYVNDGLILGQNGDYQSDEYSLGMNFAWAKSDQNIIDVKWGVSSISSCTLNEAEVNVYGLAALGNSNSIQTSDLSLKHARKYHTRVVATNSVGLKTVMCSDGIVIDTTPPVPGYLYDGSGENDTDYISSTKRVRARFLPFIDKESPIVKYEWKISHNDFNIDVTSFRTIPLTQRTPLMEGLNLRQGQKYKTVLRGINAAGLRAVVESDGFVVDTSPPICKNILDVVSQDNKEDLDFARELKGLQGKWTCSDEESSISKQLIAVGTYPGGADIQPFGNVDKFNASVLADGYMFVHVNGFDINPNVRYHITIKVLNGAGLRRTLSSDGISIDTTSPVVNSYFIKDGLKESDKRFTKEPFTFSVHWEQAFSDTESGLAEYHVGLGTEPGLTDTKKLTSVGKRNNFTLTGLILQSGRRYFATVVGCNGVGMCANASSNGMVVDYIPPHPGTIITGYKGPPALYQWITKSVWARWKWCPVDEKRSLGNLNYSQCANDSFYDVHSGISGFGLSVSSLANEQLLAEVKKVGPVRMSGRAINLKDGVYSVVVEATDKAGMKSIAHSNIFTVDSTPPIIVDVQHGHRGNKIKYTRSTNFTFQSFFELKDNLSKIASYKVLVGSYIGGEDIFRSLKTDLPEPQHTVAINWTAEHSIKLQNNRKYYITIHALNNAGLLGSGSSEALISDSEAPKNVIVLDGWEMMDVDYQSYLSIYRVHWQIINDFSGVHSVYVGLKSNSNATTCDVSPLEKAQEEANYHVLFGLNLQSGSIYYACLKVVDNAQNAGYFTSDGIVVDNTPPSPGNVIDGNSYNDIDFQTENLVLWATWSNFTEEETEIVQYKLAFGTSPGKEDIQTFTEVGLVHKSPSTRLKVTELVTGQRYYAIVIAINKLGLPSENVSSDGVLIDITPPSFIFPTTDGTNLGQDVSYSRVQSLSCSWQCNDEETKLNLVEVSFGLQPGSADVKQFTAVDVSSMRYEFQTSLKSGVIYFATVRCTNNAGLKKTSTSNGTIYDATAPQGLVVDDGDYQNSTNKLEVAWKFVDAESGIHMYQITILKSDGLFEEGPFEFQGNITSATLFLKSTLDPGTKYFTNVTGYNGAGLASSVITDGFIIDNTPPTCNRVWHGDKDFLSRLRFVSEANIFYVSWNCSDETPLTKLQFAVKEKTSPKFIVPFHSLNENKNYTGTATVTARRTGPKLQGGKTYIIGIELTNAVELTSVFWTAGVKVDTTPPIFTLLKLKFNARNNSLTAFWDVKDEESGLHVVKWGLGSSSDKTDIKNLTTVDISSTSLNIIQELQLGSTYFFSVEAINIVGLLNRAVSNGVVIDRTAPNIGIVYAQYILPLNYDRNNNIVPISSFAVSWTGFVDIESGISQYSWATGNNLQSLLTLDDNKYTNILLDESVGGVQIMNVTLVGNTTYYVCIRATNGAGLQRTDCSPGMTVILGKFSAGVVNDGPSTSKKDLDFQLDDRALWAHWDGFHDPVHGVSSYEWCIGDYPPNSSAKDICRWPYAKVNSGRNEAHRFFNITLFQGKTYYANVKAINSQGESASATSDGVVVDRSHPEGGFIKVSPAFGKDTLYTTSFQAPSVIWDMNDKESGMNHFRIGAGSFPYQDDLLSFKKVDGKTRSVNMRDLNFTVSKGLNFFVIISGFNMLGLETTLTSQQVVVDWTPPLAGIVMDGEISGAGDSETKDRNYQTSSQPISAHWYGFEDSESGIVHYKWCLGLKQGTCSLTKMVSSGLLNYVSVSLDLQEGAHYFVTVEATNGAGLTQISSSNGVTIDSSPPVISDVSFTAASDDIHLAVIGNRTYQSSGRSLRAQWRKITDIQSRIISLKYCVGKRFNVCNVIQWTHLALEETSITHIFDRPFSAGTILYVSLEAINGAGLSSRTHSKSLVIDSSPPSIGRVSVGNTNGMKYFKRGQVIEGHAIGFEDKESGIAVYQWAICFAISTRQCTDSFISTGFNYTFAKDLDLTPGVSYRLMARVQNQVRLQSEAWSNAFTIDNDYPIPKSVFDGIETTKDIVIQSSTNTLLANWEPFINLNSRITDYELCAGSKPSVCDIEPYRNVGLSLKGEISEVIVKQMNTYYITVRAWNEAGNIANASTDGVKIDSTPPIGGKIRDGNSEEDIDYQADDSFISANWDQFTDTESGIEKYIWCVGTAKGSCDVINEKVVREARYVGQQLHVPVNPGLKLYVKVTAVNGGGGKTTLYSDGVIIDSTPPKISEVKDLRTRHHLEDADFITSKAEYCVAWKAIDKESDVKKSEISVCPALTPNSDCLISSMDVGVRLAICMSNLDFLEGVKYIAKVQVTNNAGLSTWKTSDGFVFDFSPPDTGEIYHVSNLGMTETTLSHFTSSDIEVRWHGFWDKESSVSKYFICLEEAFSGTCDHITNFTDVGNRTEYSFIDQDLKHNTRYYTSLVAENGAGLQSTAVSSVGVLMDATAPILGHVLHDGDVEGKEIHFQNPTLDVKAHWTACVDPESDIIKVAWCAGTTKGLCEISKMRDISPWVYNVHAVLEKPVQNGQVLYVTVQATNGAGKTTTVTSEGVTIGGTPPKQGKVFFGNTTNEINYLFGENDIDVHWIEFADEESGIQSYEVAICDARNSANCPQPYISVNNATNVQITGLDFESGAMYIAKVRVTNFAGLKTEATSKGITVDYSPPSGSRAWLGSEGKHVFFQSSTTELKVRWQLFNDAESGIFSYEIYLTSSECNVSDYINVGLNTSYDLTNLELKHGKSYYVTLKGTNKAGLTATVTTDPITIDTTPPKPIIDSSLVNKTAKQQVLRFNCTEELVSLEWDMFGDPESGMSRYELCVGTEKRSCNIVPLTSLAPNLSSRAFTHKKITGSRLIAKFKAFNNIGLYSMESEECVFINNAPRVKYVKDLNASNISDDTEIDWTANTTSLRIKWDISDNVTEHKSKVRIEVAVTLPVSKLSYPRINSKKSWNGEPFALNFTNLQLWKSNLSIESLDLKPWEEYRGVIRVWNEGQIYSELGSDGVRLEPNPPLPHKLVIQDISAEKERLRWLPSLRLPIFNKSALIPEILCISSPSNIFVVVSYIINITNQTEAELFSDSKDFKVLVYRVRSDNNATNTSENILETKTLPGIASPQGPCCANYTPNDVTMLSDIHFKPTLPTEKFGSFVVLLKQRYLAVASLNKVFIFSLQNKSLNREVITMPETISGISHSEDRILITSTRKLHVYNLRFRKNNISLRVGKMPIISWTNLDGRIAVVHNTTIAATGRTAQNKSVVGIFHVRNGVWQVNKVLGKAENSTKFAKALAINSHFLAVLSLSYVIVYSLDDFGVAMRINLKVPQMNVAEPSLQLTKSNALILVSKKQSKIVILHLDIHTKLYEEICSYKIPLNIRLSGKFDSMDRDGGTVVALGMQTLGGVDGVLLIGFQGAFAYHPYYDLGQCLGLGRIISRDNELRVDDGVPRASVSIQSSIIVFGTPGELTWPDRTEDTGTGRVHIMTYCPLNHKRVKISTLVEQQPLECEACEDGRRSFGGVTTICTACKGRKCALPLVDDPLCLFVTKVCNNSMCPTNEQVSNKTNGIMIIQMNSTFFEEGAVNEYTVKLVETTRAGMSTTSESEPFIIDTTSPVVGTVYDGLGNDQETNCSSTETFGENSRCSTRSFQESDIDYTNNTSEVHARWIDFADNESDIAEYFWCVGTKPMLDDIRQCESTGQRQNGSHYGLDFKLDDTYYVTVVACNGAQRCSAGHSNGVTIDITPPTMQYVRDGLLGPDMDYQVFLDIIFAYFKASDENSGISSYEVAWGTAPNLTDVKDYEEIVNTTIWYAKFKNNTLEKKKKYFATVRASNKAGLLSEPMSSDGITVGKSEYIFDKNASASFFFDTVNVKTDGTREDGGVGETYGTLEVPKGAVDGEVKLQCYSLGDETIASNKSEDGPVSNPSITKPKQFMLGNYSFQIKAMDPINNTVKEGYKFAKPIKISMYYDVDNLVNANKRVVNKEVKKEDIDPVLYLWDIENNTWIDASLSCPEPWQYINRTITLLTVHICHLTQFAFFWSFKANNGLMMFDKNNSVYDANGDVIVLLETRARQIDLPIKRSKGSNGNIEVYWSLHSNKSLDSDLIWPKSGKIALKESQWNATLSLRVASIEKKTGKQVLYVRLNNVTGGAILATRDKTESSLIIVGSSEVQQDPPSTLTWIVGVVLGFISIMIVILWLTRRNRKRRKVVNNKSTSTATSPTQNQLQDGGQLDITNDTESATEIRGVAVNQGEYNNSTDLGNEIELHDIRADVGKRSSSNENKQHSKETRGARGHQGEYNNPSFENDVDVDEMRLEDQNTVAEEGINKVLKDHRQPQNSSNLRESSEAASTGAIDATPPVPKYIVSLPANGGVSGASKKKTKKTNAENRGYDNPSYQKENDDDASQC